VQILTYANHGGPLMIVLMERAHVDFWSLHCSNDPL